MKPRSVSTFRNSDFGAFIAFSRWSGGEDDGLNLYRRRRRSTRSFEFLKAKESFARRIDQTRRAWSALRSGHQAGDPQFRPP